MYFCYIDESGNPQIGMGTSHFVFLGFALPAETWKDRHKHVIDLKNQFGLETSEIHTGWIKRRYLEQERIPNFSSLSWDDRRKAVDIERKATLLKIAAIHSQKKLAFTKRAFRMTYPYVHLSFDERIKALQSIANLIGSWSDCRLFSSAIDKNSFITPANIPHYEFAFTELINRFQAFLEYRGKSINQYLTGILIQDNNPTLSKRITEMMYDFHRSGTFWRDIENIIETPLFVDSKLTSMIQLADLCSYATRRYFENDETDLFDRIFSRFDMAGSKLVGIRHNTRNEFCPCKVCSAIQPKLIQIEKKI